MTDLATLTHHRVARSIMVATLTGVPARAYTPAKTMSHRGMIRGFVGGMTFDDLVIVDRFLARNDLDERATGNYVNTLNL